MDKYARLMQRLDIVNAEFFKVHNIIISLYLFMFIFSNFIHTMLNSYIYIFFNFQFSQGICQHFGIFFHFVFLSFGQVNTNPSGNKGLHDTLNRKYIFFLPNLFINLSYSILNLSIVNFL